MKMKRTAIECVKYKTAYLKFRFFKKINKKNFKFFVLLLKNYHRLHFSLISQNFNFAD